MSLGNKIIMRGYGEGRTQIITRGYEGGLLAIIPMIIINLIGKVMTTINFTGKEDQPPQP